MAKLSTMAVASEIVAGAKVYGYDPSETNPINRSKAFLISDIVGNSTIYYDTQAEATPAAADGITDDRNNIASSDTAALLGPWELLFRKGTYLFGSNITITSPLLILPGAILKPAAGVTVTIVGQFSAGLAQCIDVSLGGRVVFSKGSVIEIYPHWWGPIASATATFTAMYAALNVGGNINGWNPQVRLPAGDYIFTATPTIPNSLSYVNHIGDGKRATRFIPSQSVAGPMMKWTNARNVWFQDIGFIWTSGATPTYGLQFDVQTAGKLATPIGCGGTRCFFGGDSLNSYAVGIGFTTEDGSDQNNEQSFWSFCDFYNLSSAGIRAEHSNSNWHTLLHCQFSGCEAAISSYKVGISGGNFTAIACRFGNTTSVTSCVLEMGGQRYPTKLITCDTEGSGYIALVWTPAAIVAGYGGAEIIGGTHSLRDTSSLKWESSTDAQGLKARFIVRDARIIAPTAVVMDFPGFDPVSLDELDVNFGTLKYNGRTTVRNINNWKSFAGGGDPTGTSYGGANARVHYEATGQATTMKALDTSTATPSVQGFAHRSTVSVAGGPITLTNLTGGYHGLELTLFFTVATVTLQTGNFYLNGTVNVTPTVNSTVTLRCNDIGGGVLRWLEIGRAIR